MRGRGDERLQARERFGAVPLEAAVRLRLDHHDAGAAHALVAETEQPLLHVLGERGGSDVEAQVDGVRDLVDVLPAGALSANRGQLDFVLRDEERRDAHGPDCT